jgi:anti-sigma factor RsiW
MECETVRELLGNYIDENLTANLRSSIDNHLRGCQTCAADMETLTAAVAAIHDVSPIEESSPWFAERLLHRLAQSTDTPLSGIAKSPKDLQLGLW